MAKQSDQDDDRDGNAEKEKQNGTHRKTPCYLFSGRYIALARLTLNSHDVIPLPASDSSREAGTECANQQCNKGPE